MPRGPRFDAPGVVQHVIQRGVERRTTFVDDVDRLDYLRRLDGILPEEDVRCLAWVLMPNHVHLILQTGRSPLARAMHRLGTGYTLYFNRRHDRVGHLVQNRFRSRPANDDADVMGLIRYAHRNPLRGGIVGSLDELAHHRWCGHGALLGARPAESFHDTRSALAYFDTDTGIARAQLRAFMRDDDAAAPLETTFTGQSNVERWSSFLAWRDRMCLAHGVAVRDLVEGSREQRVTRLRRALALDGIDRMGLRAGQIGRAIGASASGVSRAARSLRVADGAAEASASDAYEPRATRRPREDRPLSPTCSGCGSRSAGTGSRSAPLPARRSPRSRRDSGLRGSSRAPSRLATRS